jgi:hypothetical protein
MPRLNAFAFGLACGVVEGGYFCLTTLLALATGGEYARGFLQGFGSIYLGIGPTPLGVFLGLVWGFADGFLLGFLIAVVYNRLLPGVSGKGSSSA